MVCDLFQNFLKEVEKEMLNQGRELICQEVIQLGTEYRTSDKMEFKVLTDYEEGRQAWSTYNKPTSVVRIYSLTIHVQIYYRNIGISVERNQVCLLEFIIFQELKLGEVLNFDDGHICR